MSIDLKEIQRQQKTWSEYNFPDNGPLDELLGIGEELGELHHAVLKMRQKIRGDETEHVLAARDAIGDMMIYLMGYCNRMGWDLKDIIDDTWAQVKQRDWVRFPKNGKTE